MKLKLHIWRQDNAKTAGKMVSYDANHVSPDMSFLEMLDVLNQELITKGEDPVAFDHDCREGICGACSMVINGIPHGPQRATTTCQLHMRSFKDGDEVYIEPWRAEPFPVIKDLAVDRAALDRIIAAGGFISVGTGAPPDGNAIPIAKEISDLAMDAAACIGCGACVAACPNGSAMLFTAAKVSHLNLLPQGEPEKDQRVINMVAQMDAEGFGNCTNYAECQAACPKEISIQFIAKMNRDLIRAKLREGNNAGSGKTGGA
ncbi:succinate dehydrogenase/fumarate reductase iron-sulfur subunit [Herpetosiphon geysericola]|uniref:Succinate dehydrogenase n=1 Tax=Herpetosiphon geysericola TaxID=70996 RepID=A0A0P6XZN7_9CHLR|nr:succinate dehydrogenase/fumarate reductase iron-sulfur subunit [Herpetosiphon geysericola]KPL90449.1 succinate dehydrogenase [Herpetosiphon geysericola]